jgi:hypothetical protein
MQLEASSAALPICCRVWFSAYLAAIHTWLLAGKSPHDQFNADDNRGD